MLQQLQQTLERSDFGPRALAFLVENTRALTEILTFTVTFCFTTSRCSTHSTSSLIAPSQVIHPLLPPFNMCRVLSSAKARVLFHLITAYHLAHIIHIHRYSERTSIAAVSYPADILTDGSNRHRILFHHRFHCHFSRVSHIPRCTRLHIRTEQDHLYHSTSRVLP